jgi:hypothetical protein
MKNIRNLSETKYIFCNHLTVPVTRIGDAIHILEVLIGGQNARP